MTDVMKKLFSYFSWLFSVFILFIFIRISVVNVSSVSSGSMLPSFAVNDVLLVNQLKWGLSVPFVDENLYLWSLPDRGDVVLFRNPHDDQHIWMKRVIGLPGDTLMLRNHVLYLNNRPVMMDEKRREILPRRESGVAFVHRLWFSWVENDWGPITVPDQKLFLMGDNRGASDDSRYWGCLSFRQLSGQPLLRLWPL